MSSVTDSLPRLVMRPEQFWLPYHKARVMVATNFSELAAVALDILKDMKSGPIVQVCGPITSGGRSREENLKIFQSAIERLCQGHYVFNQLPFEEKFQKILKARGGNSYPQDLLDDFYLPIFQSGKIETLFFLLDWDKSTGASWEHQKALDLSIPIRYLDANFQELPPATI